MNYKIDYGKTEIDFSLDRRNRKTLAIHVYPDKHVEVVAPEESTLEQVFEKIKKRASWIIKQQNDFDKIQPAQPRPRYLSGETFRYLGKQYRLQIIEGDPVVKLKNGHFQISVPAGYSETKRAELLWGWYRKKGHQVFSERFHNCLQKTSVIGINEIPEWYIKKMPTRWGSCTAEGTVFLNPELVSAPKACIDYVIFHELCHLKELNHSRRFFTLLDRVYPDWKKYRDYLNEKIEVRMM